MDRGERRGPTARLARVYVHGRCTESRGEILVREDPTISGYDRPYYRTHGSSAYETVDPSTLVSVNAAVDCVCVCACCLCCPCCSRILAPAVLSTGTRFYCRSVGARHPTIRAAIPWPRESVPVPFCAREETLGPATKDTSRADSQWLSLSLSLSPLRVRVGCSMIAARLTVRLGLPPA